MPRLKNSQHEVFAVLISQGLTQSRAVVQAGYQCTTPESTAARGSALAKRLEVRERIAELTAKRLEKKEDSLVLNRGFVLEKLLQVANRCMQAIPVFNKESSECTECGGYAGDWKWDPKNALKALELAGLEQGMFKRSLDVTSRRVTQIEGSQDEVLEKFAQLLEKLGISAISQLLDRLGDDTLTAAMKLIGYEVAKPNGRDVEQLGAASGVDGDVDSAGEPDAERLRSSSEATPVS